VLHGAVIGGGLELAAAAHIRVAEQSAYYALPEGMREIFVVVVGAVRIPRLIGTSRMIDMMLTGRTYSAGQGAALGFSQYVVADGQGFAKAIELAEQIATNATLSNFAVLQALPRIARSDPEVGLLMESLMMAVVYERRRREDANSRFPPGSAPAACAAPDYKWAVLQRKLLAVERVLHAGRAGRSVEPPE
jgi:(methylthio)acryloyl-CoA hydratase